MNATKEATEALMQAHLKMVKGEKLTEKDRNALKALAMMKNSEFVEVESEPHKPKFCERQIDGTCQCDKDVLMNGGCLFWIAPKKEAD